MSVTAAQKTTTPANNNNNNSNNNNNTTQVSQADQKRWETALAHAVAAHNNQQPLVQNSFNNSPTSQNGNGVTPLNGPGSRGGKGPIPLTTKAPHPTTASHQDTVSDPAKRLSTDLSIAADNAKAEGKTVTQGIRSILSDSASIISKSAKVAKGDPLAITSAASKGISTIANASKSTSATLKAIRTGLNNFFQARPLLSKVATKLGVDVKSLGTPWGLETTAAKVDAGGGLLSKIGGQFASWAGTAGKTPIETISNVVNNARDTLKTFEAGGKFTKTFDLLKGQAQDVLKFGQSLTQGDSLLSKVVKGAGNTLDWAAGAAATDKIAGKFFGAARILGPVAVAASAIPDALDAANAFSKGDIKGGATSTVAAALTVGTGALMFTPAAPVAIGVAAVDLGLGLFGDKLGIGHQSIEERVAGAAVDLATKLPAAFQSLSNMPPPTGITT